jgi:hypothetical protein
MRCSAMLCYAMASRGSRLDVAFDELNVGGMWLQKDAFTLIKGGWVVIVRGELRVRL